MSATCCLEALTAHDFVLKPHLLPKWNCPQGSKQLLLRWRFLDALQWTIIRGVTLGVSYYDLLKVQLRQCWDSFERKLVKDLKIRKWYWDESETKLRWNWDRTRQNQTKLKQNWFKAEKELRQNWDRMRQNETKLKQNWVKAEKELRQNWDGTETELRQNLIRTESKLRQNWDKAEKVLR